MAATPDFAHDRCRSPTRLASHLSDSPYPPWLRSLRPIEALLIFGVIVADLGMIAYKFQQDRADNLRTQKQVDGTVEARRANQAIEQGALPAGVPRRPSLLESLPRGPPATRHSKKPLMTG